jgi:hypothetical protein
MDGAAPKYTSQSVWYCKGVLAPVCCLEILHGMRSRSAISPKGRGLIRHIESFLFERPRRKINPCRRGGKVKVCSLASSGVCFGKAVRLANHWE